MPTGSSSAHQWSPPGGLVTYGWVFAAAAGAWWWFTEAATDRLFVGVVLLALVAVSSYGSLVRPRLHADRDGIVLRSLRGEQHWEWTHATVRFRQERRLGCTLEALEIEGPGSALVVLTKLDLGQDPQEVAETLAALRP